MQQVQNLDKQRDEVFESAYVGFDFAYPVADSDGAHNKGRAKWATVYLENPSGGDSIPMVFEVIFEPRSAEIERVETYSGFAHQHEVSFQDFRE